MAPLHCLQCFIEIWDKAFTEYKTVRMNIIAFAFLGIAAAVEMAVRFNSASDSAAAEVINMAAAVTDPDNCG